MEQVLREKDLVERLISLAGDAEGVVIIVLRKYALHAVLAEAQSFAAIIGRIQGNGLDLFQMSVLILFLM